MHGAAHTGSYTDFNQITVPLTEGPAVLLHIVILVVTSILLNFQIITSTLFINTNQYILLI